MNENLNNESIKFKAFDNEGRQIDCEALFFFESPETGKHYVVFTDHSIDDEGNTRIYASAYNPEDLKTDDTNEFAALPLEPVTTDKEWKIIETILEQMDEQIKEASDNSDK